MFHAPTVITAITANSSKLLMTKKRGVSEITATTGIPAIIATNYNKLQKLQTVISANNYNNCNNC
jgi:hypothetical protein